MIADNQRWYAAADVRPHQDQKVQWLVSNGEVVNGQYHEGLWFLGDDMAMCVHYEPKFWRPRP